MSGLTLVVMAAGRGSRYGGLKQVEPVGPSGESILEYSIYDSIMAGFKEVVFVIRKDIEEVFRAAVGRRIEGIMDVSYVFQDSGHVAGSELVVPARDKPWGTAHAILATADFVHSPFAVVNADDFYGRDSFRILGDQLQDARSEAVLVGFELQNTLSEHGAVKRGLCAVDAEGWLESVVEIEDVRAVPAGVSYKTSGNVVSTLAGTEVCSMNMWGFQPSLFEKLRAKWEDFLRINSASQTAEFYVPSAVTDLINEGELRCRVVPTTSAWFGVTFPEDRAVVVDRLATLVRTGDYPPALITEALRDQVE